MFSRDLRTHMDRCFCCRHHWQQRRRHRGRFGHQMNCYIWFTQAFRFYIRSSAVCHQRTWPVLYIALDLKMDGLGVYSVYTACLVVPEWATSDAGHMYDNLSENKCVIN
jgi:hypothetical protein